MLPRSTVNTDADAFIDITGERCPMTFVRVRLALDRLESGQVLKIRLQGDEPRSNVPRTAEQQGHVVLDRRDDGAVSEMLIRKG